MSWTRSSSIVFSRLPNKCILIPVKQCCGSALFWCWSGSGSHPRFYTCWKIRILLYFFYSSTIGFIFLVSVIVNLFYFLESKLKFSEKKYSLIYIWFKWTWIRIGRLDSRYLSGSAKMMPIRPDRTHDTAIVRPLSVSFFIEKEPHKQLRMKRKRKGER
jgi:hypothetical protein